MIGAELIRSEHNGAGTLNFEISMEALRPSEATVLSCLRRSSVE